MSIIDLIDKQLDAYTKKDIEGLVSFYHEDIKFIKIDDWTVVLNGKAEVIKNHQEKIFSHQDLDVKIISRIVLDDLLIDLENVSGLNTPFSITIYKVRDDKIYEIWCKNGIDAHHISNS
ncbi:hypothetical protein CWS43_04915 [Rahnella sp. AA]|uniref:nuclear transport factor 2 family protein n=1 Tax=Rahnella sp. AA TaxID=2057180 RepID=UPI000C3277FD|nr:hypothetical protein [Rahnella sp. AA]PKE31404.1 hypothetical protein CWS43_04915 [Rahnella sp. AA]